GVVVLDAGDVERDRTAGGLLLRFVVEGEVGAERGPAMAAAGRFEDALGAGVQRVVIVRRDDPRLGPLEAMLELPRAASGSVERPRIDELRLIRFLLPARERAAVVAGV